MKPEDVPTHEREDRGHRMKYSALGRAKIFVEEKFGFSFELDRIDSIEDLKKMLTDTLEGVEYLEKNTK